MQIQEARRRRYSRRWRWRSVRNQTPVPTSMAQQRTKSAGYHSRLLKERKSCARVMSSATRNQTPAVGGRGDGTPGKKQKAGNRKQEWGRGEGSALGKPRRTSAAQRPWRPGAVSARGGE